jgi:stage II sporulation protein AA (anti-sigma F factor antagonist)
MRGVDEAMSGAARAAGSEGPSAPEPEVTCVVEADVAHVTVTGELTGAARRPLVRVMTDLLLGQSALRRVELELSGVSFMNSAGMAVLVQLQRLGQPRDVEVVLVDPPPGVIRPLQLSGLWHRFRIEERGSGAPER